MPVVVGIGLMLTGNPIAAQSPPEPVEVPMPATIDPLPTTGGYPLAGQADGNRSSPAVEYVHSCGLQATSDGRTPTTTTYAAQIQGEPTMGCLMATVRLLAAFYNCSECHTLSEESSNIEILLCAGCIANEVQDDEDVEECFNSIEGWVRSVIGGLFD